MTKIPLKPILAGLGVAGVALYGAKKLYDSMSDSHITYCDDDKKVKTELDEFLHNIAKDNLASNDYDRLCALANSDSDLSEADSAEYIALEKRAKEPIIRALEHFSFTDCFVAIINEAFRDDNLLLEAIHKNNYNLYTSIIFLTLSFKDELLKAALQSELTGNQMATFEQFNQFMDNVEENSAICAIVESSEFSNDEKMRKILETLSDNERKIVENFKEVWCSKAVEIIKDFVNQPLRELYRQ